MAEWIRKNGNCLAVVVVRVHDAALAADPAMPAGDATEIIGRYLPELAANLAAAHKESKNTARLELGELTE